MSVLIATKVKDAGLWLPRFITQVENLQGDIEKVVVMYGESRDNSLMYLKHWQETSRHLVEIYKDPYLPHDERHGAMLARVKQDIQKILAESNAEYYLNLDCDLVRLPPDLIPQLMEADKDIIAGMVWTEGRDISTFFDTYIFRINGFRFHPFNPPGLGKTEPFEVDSMSTCYLAKKEVELAGVYVNPYPHVPFCADLKSKGYKVWVHPGVHTFHVDLEEMGIMHQPLPVNLSISPFIDNDGNQYVPEQIGAMDHHLKLLQYKANLMRKVSDYWEVERDLQRFDTTRPILTASYKAHPELYDFLPLSINSIYPYVDKIDIAIGPLKSRMHTYINTPKPAIFDPEKKIRWIYDIWDTKEQIQKRLLDFCTSKWMLFIDADEIISGMEVVRDFCDKYAHEGMGDHKIYARPERMYNFFVDFNHIAYSLNPVSPWAQFGMPHPFLIYRDIPGLNFGAFHTMPSDGFGRFVAADEPTQRHKKAVLDGVEIYHFGNALGIDKIESKRDYYKARGDQVVYEDQILSGELAPDMVIEKFDNYPLSVRNILKEHPDFGRTKVKITKTAPTFCFEVIK